LGFSTGKIGYLYISYYKGLVGQDEGAIVKNLKYSLERGNISAIPVTLPPPIPQSCI